MVTIFMTILSIIFAPVIISIWIVKKIVNSEIFQDVIEGFGFEKSSWN